MPAIQSIIRVFKWLFAAADANHPRSQYYVGTAYADGLGVEAEAVEAAMWLTLAGNQGVGASKSAMKDLGEKADKADKADIEKGVARAEEWIPIYDREIVASTSS